MLYIASGRMWSGGYMEKLVKKAKKGDAEAFITLMEQNKQTMKRVAYAYLGDRKSTRLNSSHRL